MRLIIIAFRLIMKKKLGVSLLIFQMIITAIILITLLGKIHHIYESYNIIDIFSKKDAYYFNLHSFYEPEKFDLKAILQKKAKISFDIGKIVELSVSTNGSGVIPAIGYNDELLKSVSINMESGKWFDLNKSYNEIPIIAIGERYKTGQIVYLSKSKIKALVIGTIGKGSFLPAANGFSSSGLSDIENLVSNVRYDFIIPYDCKKIPSINLKSVEYGYLQNFFLIMDKDNYIKNNNIDKYLSEYGQISSIEIMKENYFNRLQDFFTENGLVFLIFSITTIVGIGGINIISSLENEIRYVVYYVYGMTKKQYLLIEIIRAGFQLVLGFSLTLGIFYLTPLKRGFSGVMFTINSITFTIVFAYFVLIYIVSSLLISLRLWDKTYQKSSNFANNIKGD